jgi:hypothetical protein
MPARILFRDSSSAPEVPVAEPVESQRAAAPAVLVAMEDKALSAAVALAAAADSRARLLHRVVAAEMES